MTQKVPQKVLDKVGDCGWRAESFREPNSLGFRERMLGPVRGIFSKRIRNEDQKKSQTRSTKKKKNHEKNLHSHECFLTGDWNDPTGTYGGP